jgi:hypothetical protein
VWGGGRWGSLWLVTLKLGPKNTGARFDHSIKAAESEIEKPSGVQ